MSLRSILHVAATALALSACVDDPSLSDELDLGSEDQELITINPGTLSALLPTPWVSHHGMTAAQYQAKFDELVAQGYRLTDVSGYNVGGTVRYTGLWEKITNGPAWVARHGMTAAEYQSYFNTYTSQGYRLKVVDGYESGGQARYAAIWDKSTGPAWVARHGLTSGGYQHEFIDNSIRGYRLKKVDGYAIGSSDRYAAIWEAEPTALTGNYCKNSKCFNLQTMANNLANAIDPAMAKWGFEVRRGLSVIQRADGPGRTTADLPATSFTVNDRFNPASVSKSVTSVALLQLLHQRGIAITTPIWTYLPSHWNIPANNKTITFAQILNHTSGLRNDNAGGDYLYANMKTLMETSINLADKIDSYANVNTAVARILVASLDGYTNWIANPDGSAARFITYVNNNIWGPLGVYDVAYKATGTAPTLFYPNPTGTAHGTAYGDWTLKPGSAGGHNSIHELAVFAAATFNGMLLPTTKINEIKTNSLGFGDYGTYPDGTKCFGKGGYFPGSWNGGAELNTVLISCDNGINAMVMVNGEMSPAAAFQNAMNSAFTNQ